MAGSRERAEDLFQETCKRVHEKAHTLRGDGFRAWLFRIATHVAVDGVRRQSRGLKVVSLNRNSDCSNDYEATVADNRNEPAGQVIRAEQREQVRRAVELLPERQRAALVLAYYQQLSYPEVAEVLGCSVGAVKTQMYRALKTLARKLPDISGGVE
jgi:RNA polymerase sigma-70 factor (ECF subfamily)